MKKLLLRLLLIPIIMEGKLIKAVQMHNCLYDKGMPSYRNKLKKQKAWLNVAAVVGADVEQCQSRWRSLRDRFVKELAKKPTSEESSWAYFQILTFLKVHVAPRRPFSNTQWDTSDTLTQSGPPVASATESWGVESSSSPIGADISFLDLNNCINDSSADIPSTSTPSARQKRARVQVEASERFEKLMEAVTNIVQTDLRSSRNSDFLKVLDEYLLKLPENTQDNLKIQLLNTVFAEVSNQNTQ